MKPFLVLVLAERSEVEIINFLRQRSNAAQALSPPPGISALPTPLGTALNDRNGISFDKLRATVVLSWILWVLNEPQLALERLFTIDFDAISEEELKGQDMKDSKHDTVIEGYLLKGEETAKMQRGNLLYRTWLIVFRHYSRKYRSAGQRYWYIYCFIALSLVYSFHLCRPKEPLCLQPSVQSLG